MHNTLMPVFEGAINAQGSMDKSMWARRVGYRPKSLTLLLLFTGAIACAAAVTWLVLAHAGMLQTHSMLSQNASTIAAHASEQGSAGEAGKHLPISTASANSLHRGDAVAIQQSSSSPTVQQHHQQQQGQQQHQQQHQHQDTKTWIPHPSPPVQPGGHAAIGAGSASAVLPPADEFTASRLAVNEYLESPAFRARQADLAKLQGRGIVILAGGLSKLSNAYISVKILREVVGSNMPVEIAHNGQQELHQGMVHKLASLSYVRFVDISKIPPLAHHHTTQRLSGWYVKAMPLYSASAFREVLLLDADNMLLIPPEQLFDTPDWKQYGNLFWPDFYVGGEPRRSPTRAAFTKLGLRVPWDLHNGPHFRSVESGQVLLDRAHHADVLEWLLFLTAHHGYFGPDLNGDKDMFEMAFMLADKEREYRQVRIAAAQALGYAHHDNTYHHRGMLQHAPDGRYAFHHRTAGSKLLRYCREPDRKRSSCRVWHAHDVDLNAWSTLNCSHIDSRHSGNHDGNSASSASSTYDSSSNSINGSSSGSKSGSNSSSGSSNMNDSISGSTNMNGSTSGSSNTNGSSSGSSSGSALIAGQVTNKVRPAFRSLSRSKKPATGSAGHPYWPGVRCQEAAEEIVAIPVHKLPSVAHIMNTAFDLFWQLENLTATDW